MVLIYFAITAFLHLLALSIPLFFDIFVLPGYLALFMLVSLATAVPSAWLKRLRPWQIVAFLPVLFAIDEASLAIIHATGGWLRSRAVVSPDEFLNAIAGTGVLVSVGSWFLTGVVIIVSLVVKRQREILFVHRLVDTNDEWERVYAFLQLHNATRGISPFHWRLLRQRTFCFIAEQADILRASILLVPATPGTACLSDFVMDSPETGAELLGAVLNRPELRSCTELHLIERNSEHNAEPEGSQHTADYLFRQLIPEGRMLEPPASTPDFLTTFSPDGSKLRPFAGSRVLASARGEADPELLD